MNTFTIIQSALDASANDADKAQVRADHADIGRLLAAVQTVVDALTPPDGGRYIVGFADITTAQTSLGERRITVSSKPLNDKTLSLVEKAVVIATFAAHEIGHTIVTRPRGMRVEQHNPKSGYHAVANIADDIILEPYMVDRYPILADAFAFTGLWVLRNTAKTLPKVESLSSTSTTVERFNALLSATRYGDTDLIVWKGAAAQAERVWGRDWAARLIATRLTDHATFLALCDEAWARLRSTVEDEDEEPEAPPTTDGPTGPGGDEPPPPSDEQGEDEGEGGSDESDEGGEDEGNPAPSDEDGEGEPEGEGEDGDDATDDEPEGEGKGKGEGEGDDEPDANDQPLDFDEDDADPGTDDVGDTKDGSDIADDATGGGGNAEQDAPLRDEDDFNKDDLDKGMHDQAERPSYDYEGERAEEAAREYASSTVTAFGRHGSLSTNWT